MNHIEGRMPGYLEGDMGARSYAQITPKLWNWPRCVQEAARNATPLKGWSMREEREPKVHYNIMNCLAYALELARGAVACHR